MDLIKLTDITITELLKKDVVLPSLYKKKFELHAKDNGIDFDDDTFVAHSNEATIQKANDILDSTNEKLVKLSSSAQDAHDAIQSGDDDKLQRVSSEVEKLKQEMEQLKARVYKDPLTGEYNRQWIADIFLDSDGLFPDKGALIFIDLDKFKFINDTYGHNVGDKVLIYIAHFLSKKCHVSNLVRFAGDEFILLAPTSDIDSLYQNFSQAREELTQKKIKAANGDLLHLDFSFGITPYQQGDSFKSIVEIADALMYEHKQLKKVERGA